MCRGITRPIMDGQMGSHGKKIKKDDKKNFCTALQ
jgi:hypothetical protein